MYCSQLPILGQYGGNRWLSPCKKINTIKKKRKCTCNTWQPLLSTSVASFQRTHRYINLEVNKRNIVLMTGKTRLLLPEITEEASLYIVDFWCPTASISTRRPAEPIIGKGGQLSKRQIKNHPMYPVRPNCSSKARRNASNKLLGQLEKLMRWYLTRYIIWCIVAVSWSLFFSSHHDSCAIVPDSARIPRHIRARY